MLPTLVKLQQTRSCQLFTSEHQAAVLPAFTPVWVLQYPIIVILLRHSIFHQVKAAVTMTMRPNRVLPR